MRGGAALGAMTCVAVACGPVTAPQQSSAPVNACPDHPCGSYAQTGGVTPQCDPTLDACVVPAELSGDVVLVASLPQDSYYAPGVTLVLPFGDLLSSGAFHDAQCGGRCVKLPPVALAAQGHLECSPSDAVDADWYLGNPGQATTVPSRATFRLLWPPPGGSSGPEAASLGLPVSPIDAAQVIEEPGAAPPGPGQGAAIGFVAQMPAWTYERTLMPEPPFDRAFPPDIQMRSVPPGDSIDPATAQPGGDFDLTNGFYPTFNLSRTAGLDGWSAYLRDERTLRRVSNFAALQGTTDDGVRLLTRRHQPNDALANAALVVQPPEGQPVPRLVIGAVSSGSTGPSSIPEDESYPTLPPPAHVGGRVSLATGAAISAATLTFEAQGICRFGAGTMSGVPVLDSNGDLEFETGASSRSDGTYAVDLPPGQYRLTIRPPDDRAEVTVLSFSVGPPQCVPVSSPTSFALAGLQTVTGSATVADGRPLSGALVDAIPMQCAELATAGSVTTASCLPRPAATTTGSDGSFVLHLDPGTYELRVRPEDGSRLPWVFQPGGLAVPQPSTSAPDAPIALGVLAVPAPANVSLELVDPAHNPIVNAVVRLYVLQPGGPALEVGDAMTDAGGNYEMFVTPDAVEPK